jgi:Tol biopolymer transport system component
VAEEPIDSHIVYRRLAPNKQLSEIRGIFQRDLESFSCSAIVTPQEGTVECFNCHTFWQNNSKQFLIHQRGVNPGMVLVTDAKPRKINTQAPPPMWRHLAFASWHPDGIHIAATINQYIDHESSTERLSYFETVEKRGDLVVYNVEKNTLSTTPAVFGPEYIETHPCWFPDGKFICFSRGKDRTIFSSKDFNEFRHDLMRISFDVTTETWGSPETLMAYSRRGKSCAFPRPSPCGKFVLLVLSNKTTYPIHQESSDLYLFDMKTKETRPLDAVNSPLAESFPCWSSNGRWFSFVSTRRDGICALPYFAYFDKNGQAHKAFLLPEKDPVRWDTYTDTYNVVELVKSRVTIDPFDLISVMNRPGKPALFPNPPRPGTSGY